MNYYNDNEPYAAQWLRNLVAAGALPAGTVDARSIADLGPGDFAGYTQCHFFAGIGGWPLALDLAGWPLDRPVWTGSCPCQPFSSAGKQRGAADERHLWPLWLRLIRVCRPDTIFGEQVAGAVGFGWWDRVCADLEALGYACGAAVLGAHSVGAPHIRQRLFWVADASGEECGRRTHARTPEQRIQQLGCNGAAGGLADAQHALGRPLNLDRQDGRDGQDSGRQETHGEPGTRSQVRGLGDTQGEGPQRQRPLGGTPQGELHRRQPRLPGEPWSDAVWLPCLDGAGFEAPDNFPSGANPRSKQPENTGFWDDTVWLPCLDGNARRVEPTIFPLAHAGEWGTGSRVGILRGAGNAIVPAVAAEFIKAFLEC